MQCIHCGYQLTAFDVKCPRCGKTASDPVEPRQSAAGIPSAPPLTPGAAPPYQRPGYLPPAPVSDPDDRPNSGFAIVGFLFPIIGLIMYLVTMSSKPRKAASALKGAGLGFGLGIVFFLILTVLGGKAANDFSNAQRQIDASNNTTIQPR